MVGLHVGVVSLTNNVELSVRNSVALGFAPWLTRNWICPDLQSYLASLFVCDVCFERSESIGVPFPKSQPMRIYSSLWNADDWATRGGLVKTDWTKAPFTAYYRNFKANACTWSYGASSCGSKPSSAFSDGAWKTNELDAPSRRRLRWVQKYFMIYNYCTDLRRFPQGPPPECK